MSCGSIYAPQLRALGFRMTPQRMAILHVLHQSDRHLSPAQVFEQARQAMPGMTETTVYRTLEFLTKNDLVMPAHLGNGHLLYEIAGHEHHHLICRGCGKTVEVDHKLLQSLYQRLEDISGYRLNTSHLTFVGLCPDCKNKGNNKDIKR
jgi:Fe2+ or Zn2+ uptake regulation protein